MSRYAPSEDSYSRYAPSSPISYVGDDAHAGDPDVKAMRLKVLYTTDDKTNCMARWPKALPVRTAFLDEKTEIGVVELRTCIKAIVTSSPELVAKLGHDYTVYAYDYSEYETPLVGQGMLSWVLASTSTQPGHASPSGTMVTGRVTKNANALFGRDTCTQTLEVKLRLVPVPTISQSDYIESMKRYRDISRVMPESFDPQGWTDFLKANPQVLSTMGFAGPISPQPGPDTAAGLQNIQRLVQQGQHLGSRSQYSSHSRRGSFAESYVSRDGSPTPSVQSAYPEPYRPASQASTRGDLRRTASTGQIPGSDFDNDDNIDDGPARKRARITQVRRPRKNAGFGNQVDSLRVAASAANSIRVLQPTAVRPGMAGIASLEEPPRAPTPVARGPGLAPRRSVQQPRSSLSRFATVAQDHFPQESTRGPYSSITSPDAHSVLESSPGEDPGSSPPMPADRSYLTAPSSPQLPRMPIHEDSGFMSGAIDDDNDDVAKLSQQNLEPSSSHAHRSIDSSRPRKIAAKLTRAESSMTAEEKAAETSRKNALRAIGWRRVQSYSEGQASNIDSSNAASEDKSLRPTAEDRVKSKNSYDKEVQRKRLENRLMAAIAAGEKPPLCENCGAVDSQTWRKAFKRRHCGAPTDVRVGKGPGAILTVLVEERDAGGAISMFSIIKKSLASGDEGFDEMLLCNPCGLWLNKRGEMRPPRIWNQNNNVPRIKTDTSARGQTFDSSAQSRAEQRPVAPLPSEMTEPPSEAPLPSFISQYDNYDRDTASLERQQTRSQEPETEPELPTLPEARHLGAGNNARGRSDSEIPTNAVTALQRAIRSSPGQLRGSQHSPIDVDGTPDRTRRALFPSPKSRGPLGVSAGNKAGALRDSPDAPKQKRPENYVPVMTLTLEAEKENTMPPPPPKQAVQERAVTPTPRDDDADYFSDFFKDSNAAPSTPSRSHAITLPVPKSPSNFFRTPTKGTPQKAFSSAERAFLHAHPHTPTRTPSRAAARNTPGSAADTPFTRQLKNIFSADPPHFDFETSPSKVFGDMVSDMVGDDFHSDWPMTTDMPMPSSPPIVRTRAHVGTESQMFKTPRPKEAANDDDSPDWDDLGLGKTPGMPGVDKVDAAVPGDD